MRALIVTSLALLVGGWLASRGVALAHEQGLRVAQGASSSNAHTSTLDVHDIPLGDGKLSSAPRVGYVFSCQSQFNGRGAQGNDPWIHGKTWDLAEKGKVEGQVSWPSARFSVSVDGATRVLMGNGLPVDATTGEFPIRPSDPMYRYDRNPNRIRVQRVLVRLPADPKLAATPSCLPLGPIGYALNGVAIFDALDALGRDAAHEVQDSCDGHPQLRGIYHYHTPSDCMPHANENNALVGYALDGFGIYSMYDANGREYTNADLDACHGTTSPVLWDGKMVNMYHYVLTWEYPYTLGCFRGTPVAGPRGMGGGEQGLGGGLQGMQGRQPPQQAIDACASKARRQSCSFTGLRGTITGVCRTPPNLTTLVCVPPR